MLLWLGAACCRLPPPVAVPEAAGDNVLPAPCLLLLTHPPSFSTQQPPLALIVDHQLRPESSEEAQAVARQVRAAARQEPPKLLWRGVAGVCCWKRTYACGLEGLPYRLSPPSGLVLHPPLTTSQRQAEALGMQTRLLTVKWPEGQLPSMGDKMAAAREARYALLLRACGELGRSHLLLAHHADDQAETFLLRLMHASGVAGLACMPRVVEKRTGAVGGRGSLWHPGMAAVYRSRIHCPRANPCRHHAHCRCRLWAGEAGAAPAGVPQG